MFLKYLWQDIRVLKKRISRVNRSMLQHSSGQDLVKLEPDLHENNPVTVSSSES